MRMLVLELRTRVRWETEVSSTALIVLMSMHHTIMSTMGMSMSMIVTKLATGPGCLRSR